MIHLVPCEMMTLSGKQRGELVKSFHLSGENFALAVRVHCRNHKLIRGPCSVKSVRNLVKKFEKTGCTCDRPQSEWPRFLIKIGGEVHNTMTKGSLHTVRNVFRNLYLPKTAVLKILCSDLQMFPYRFQRVWALETGDNQQRVNFENFASSDMMKVAWGRCGYYGRMRHISPSLRK